MDSQKHIEILKKRNIALSTQLEEAKQKVQELENADTSKDDLDSLITEIEGLRKQFTEAIKDLDKAREKYNTLNKELMAIKQDFQIFRIPWYRKLFPNKK